MTFVANIEWETFRQSEQLHRKGWTIPGAFSGWASVSKAPLHWHDSEECRGEREDTHNDHLHLAAETRCRRFVLVGPSVLDQRVVGDLLRRGVRVVLGGFDNSRGHLECEGEVKEECEQVTRVAD